MFVHKKINDFNDFFTPLRNRNGRCVYFYRINGVTDEVRKFIRTYYKAASQNGVIIEGGIPNPDTHHISFYAERLGTTFTLDKQRIVGDLSKWLPRMSPYTRDSVAESIYNVLVGLQREGKNEGMLKNAYIKFMCWLYYKFERITVLLGSDKVPKILYEGEISNYELLLLSVLTGAGCDAVILQYRGDVAYKKLDPTSARSELLELPGMTAFPDGYCIKTVRTEIAAEEERQKLYGDAPDIIPCVNAWMKGEGFDDVKKPVHERGSDPMTYYSCFMRISGAESKASYQNDVFRLHADASAAGRGVLIIDEKIPDPDPQETGSVIRRNYQRPEDLIRDMSAQIRANDLQLQRLMQRAFVDVMLIEVNHNEPLNKLGIYGVYLICWMRRYYMQLFRDWRMPNVAMLLYLGSVRDEREEIFLRFMARLPVDVILLNPEANSNCILRDELLFDKHYDESTTLSRIPRETSDLRLGTTAYHAERELDQLMYQDSGLYRNQQYGKADSITLRTMYEEIEILWNEEARFRPNFSTIDGVVNIPVIFAQVSGVKDGDTSEYWKAVSRLVTDDAYVITRQLPLSLMGQNPFFNQTGQFFMRGRLDRNAVKAHPSYPYGYLRLEVQERILDKLELLLDQRIIKGTYENGIENLIVATILHLPLEVMRRIQAFDFTKVPPKLLYIKTSEGMVPPEDAIVAAFLNLMGFDVLFFAPTGYRCVASYYTRELLDEHQLGEYKYDLRVPDLSRAAEKNRKRAEKAKSGSGWSLFRKRGK